MAEKEIPQGITVSEFDYSVENHFKAVDKISALCDEARDFDFDEVQCLSYSIKFLREWRQFSYPSRTLRFISQKESHLGKDFVGAVTLPQFSSVSVPKNTSELRKDFVMHVGGLVSALDWCPRIHPHSNSEFRSEFVAVAAHPSESSYHRIGEPVAGLGMVQIWCVLSSNRKKSLVDSNPKKRKQREICTEKSSEPKRPRGRPRKNSTNAITLIPDAGDKVHMATVDENAALSSQDIPTRHNFPDAIGCDVIPTDCSAPDDIALPRLMFCLAHNGKVAWDLKWRPSGACDQRRMGNLAVLLGNGGMEVWEVPFPRIVNSIYSNSQKDATDPRFIKLQPVFRCSTIKNGDRQSIPLSLEWSSSSPHDKILAGCHDGTVALWKFCANNSLEETRPLLCFTADTVPIRTLSWAPAESSSEGSNVVVTGGLKGLKFWDLRDPFNPLWTINPFERNIYSLDWISDPKCIIVAFDDGTLRILNILRSAIDVPAVTGEPFVGTQQKGYNSYYCSKFSIWSVHVSRLTGMVAYCGADGTALYFKLTNKAMGNDPTRNRAPHFLCGVLVEEESTLTMLTPLSNIPFPMKKTNSEKGFKEKMENVQRSDEQPLALCYNIDARSEFGTNEDENQAKDAQLSIGKVVNNEADKRFESLPPKMVALHKVRWNVNVGSENWLGYGGAAGVLRCQEMDTI